MLNVGFLDTLYARANGYKRTMVRLLFDELLKDEKSLNYETAEKINKRLPQLQTAIIGK